MRFTRRSTLILLALVLAAPLSAQPVPTEMNYQGRLTDNTPGQNPVTVAVPMEFKIYGSLIGADLLWNEAWGSVSVNDGIFSVLLGSNGTPIPATIFTAGIPRFLEIVVDGETLSPRQQLGTVGYAGKAASSADLECVDCVRTEEIDDASVALVDMAGDAVDSATVLDNSLTAADLAAGSVGSSEIAAGSVGSSEIAAGAVTASELAAGSVGASALDSTDSFTVDGLTVTGPVEIGGSIEEIGCVDGTVEQRFPVVGNSSLALPMVGCSGAVSFLDRETICAPGWAVCEESDWTINHGATAPTADYWLAEKLNYSGSASNACTVEIGTGLSCGATNSMKVCDPGGSCTWKNCANDSGLAGFHDYFGGCNPSTAGALCCKGSAGPATYSFHDTASDELSDTSLEDAFSSLALGTNWFMFVDVKRNGGAPMQYCLSDAKWYVDMYLNFTPGAGGSTGDPLLTKWYRADPADPWIETTTSFTNYYGTSCASGSYDWCISWGMGGFNLAIAPTGVGWGEVWGAGSEPSNLRFYIGPDRFTTCGF